MTPDYDRQALHRDASVIDFHDNSIIGLIRRNCQRMAECGSRP